MMYRRHHSIASSLLLTGLLVMLMSLSGGWGIAYGQTAGPTPTPGPATLSITKEADNPNPAPGETVVFIIRVSNTGSEAARDVQVEDAVPGAFEVVNVYTTLGIASVSGQNVIANIPQLDPGVSAVITVETRLRAGASGQLTNEVVARAIAVDGAALPPQRAQAVLAVEADTVPDTNIASGAGTDTGTLPSQLSNTGAEGGVQWSLLMIGLLLMLLGTAIFVRARKTS